MGRTLELMLADEKPEVVAAAQAEANEMLLEVNLAMLRDRVRKTQIEMAQALGVKQPTIAGIEKAGRDLKLSTLKRYVEALGGKVRLDIKLPDGTRYDFTL